MVIIASPYKDIPLVLLLGHTDGTSLASCGLGMLSTHTQTPVVAETTVSTDLLQSLQVFAPLVIEGVRQHLRVFAIFYVLLPIEEPVRYLVLSWVLHDGDHALHLFFG